MSKSFSHFRNFFKQNSNKGFTLLELLIVVGIIAITSVATVLLLNPAEALKKTRDTQRISDLTTLKKAIAIYLTNTSYPKFAGIDNSGCKGTAFGSTWQLDTDHIYYSYPSDASGAPITGKNLDGVTFTTGGASQVSKANLGKVDGTGWLPIDFTSMSGGSPISALPVDPVNTIADPANPKSTDLVYRYVCSEQNLTYELGTTLESDAYTVTDNKMSKDGGNNNSYYEAGTGLALMNTESPLVQVLSVGDIYGGGKVAYILQSGDPGYDAGVQHGLISSLVDQSTNSYWGTLPSCITTDIIGADGIAIGTGRQNTIDMIAAGCANAAQLVNGVNINGYNDWYLPSKDELNKLYLNWGILAFIDSVESKKFTYKFPFINITEAAAPSSFWASSSEFDSVNVWIQSLTSGNQSTYSKNTQFRVRAIRSF